MNSSFPLLRKLTEEESRSFWMVYLITADHSINGLTKRRFTKEERNMRRALISIRTVRITVSSALMIKMHGLTTTHMTAGGDMIRFQNLIMRSRKNSMII